MAGPGGSDRDGSRDDGSRDDPYRDDDGAWDDYDDGDGYDDGPEWTDEDEERYQARVAADRRRKHVRRRQAWSFTALVLVVGLLGLGGAGVVQGWWAWPFGQGGDGRAGEGSNVCPTPSSTLSAPAATQVQVLNATQRRGLAADVAAQLGQRGYKIAGIGNDDSGVAVAEPAQVRHGPEGVLQAQTVAINIPGAVLVDDGRPGNQVELALGEGFAALATPEEVAAALAPVAPTSSPAGCTPPPTTPPPTTPPATDPAATTPPPTG